MLNVISAGLGGFLLWTVGVAVQAILFVFFFGSGALLEGYIGPAVIGYISSLWSSIFLVSPGIKRLAPDSEKKTEWLIIGGLAILFWGAAISLALNRQIGVEVHWASLVIFAVCSMAPIYIAFRERWGIRG